MASVRWGVSRSKISRVTSASCALIEEDASAFKDYYRFCFDFSKQPGFGVRTLPIEVAKQMWSLTLAPRFAHMDTWFEFLEGQ